MAAVFRSKDEKFMKRLKNAVYDGMDGLDIEDQRRAWKGIQRKVFLDDLHKIAIEKLEADEPVYMGHGSFVPDLMVITSKSLEFSKEAKELVETIMNAGKMKDVYYTGKYKTKRIFKSQLEPSDEVLRLEMKVVQPRAILCFGTVFPELPMRTLVELDGTPLIQTHPLSEIMGQQDEESVKAIKGEIWNDMKQIKAKLKA